VDEAAEDALWRDAALADDVGPRLVLADHLLQTGQRRGELITLQCSDAPATADRARQLVDAYWARWLGALGLVLDRGGTQFERGLLHVITVGRAHTPPWAYAKVAAHRELWSVRHVRPSWKIDPDPYVDFVAHLAHLPPAITLGAAMVPAFTHARAAWPFRTVEYVPNFYRSRDGGPPLLATLTRAAAVLPDAEALRLTTDDAPLAELPEVVVTLPSLFPRLARIEIDARYYMPPHQRELFRALETLPLVHVDHGVRRDP